MLDWLYYLILLLVLLTGLLLNVLSLPGNWVMLLAVVLYGWVTEWAYVGWVWIVVFLVIALAAEVVEFYAGGAGAKKAGGGVWGTVGALAGAVIGGIFLTGLILVPVIGTLAGIILGTFLGAMVAEMLAGQEAGKSALIGVGAAQGRLYGTLLKLGSGCILMILMLVATLPWGGRPITTTPALSPVQPTPVTPAPAPVTPLVTPP